MGVCIIYQLGPSTMVLNQMVSTSTSVRMGMASVQVDEHGKTCKTYHDMGVSIVLGVSKMVGWFTVENPIVRNG